LQKTGNYTKINKTWRSNSLNYSAFTEKRVIRDLPQINRSSFYVRISTEREDIGYGQEYLSTGTYYHKIVAKKNSF
jgi:hypothetical protein